jgi:hypothetical protein
VDEKNFLAECKDKQQALVNTTMRLQVPQMQEISNLVGELLISQEGFWF